MKSFLRERPAHHFTDGKAMYLQSPSQESQNNELCPSEEGVGFVIAPSQTEQIKTLSEGFF